MKKPKIKGKPTKLPSPFETTVHKAKQITENSSKGGKVSEQIAMFGTHQFPSLDEVLDIDKESPEGLINLRKEVKYDIPNTTYITHAIHNFYPAKFIPQVPRFVINQFGLKGKIILDPFAGSGTTAVESLITGNSNISNDINPITRFLIDIKTLKLNSTNYFGYKDKLNYHTRRMFESNAKFIPKWENLDYWYPADILSVLKKMWGYIHNIENEDDIKYILKAGALYISRKYSYGDDESPKLFRSKQKTMRMKKLSNKFHEFGEELLQNELLKKAYEYLDYIIQMNLRYKLEYKKVDSLREANEHFLLVLNNSVEELEQRLPENSVDCIITSPPYIYAQEYFRSTKVDMYWLDITDDKSIRKLTNKEIGQKFRSFCDLNSILSEVESYKDAFESIKRCSESFKTKENILRFSAYFSDILYFLQLSAKLLNKNGIIAIFIGEPRVFGYYVKVKDIISEMLMQNNFRIKHTFFDIIKSRHLSRNRLNENPRGINGEWLIIGEKV